MKKISVPALLVYAVPGSLYYEGVARYMESQVPGAKLLLIQDATHAFTDAQTEEYMNAMTRFVMGEDF